MCDLALTYYKERNSAQDTQGLTAAAQTNEDGTVTIQVYENLGDHNSTAAWYTVDRVTAQGTDGNGQAVDREGGLPTCPNPPPPARMRPGAGRGFACPLIGSVFLVHPQTRRIRPSFRGLGVGWGSPLRG